MRPIDADAIEKLEWITERGMADCGEEFVYLSAINKMPTIDAVPVTRCKDCKHHHGTDCEVWDYRKTEDDKWCAWAERREK